ncbi:MAG: hypothetical protein RL610_595, partial [Pseudomonadota bacterium]
CRLVVPLVRDGIVYIAHSWDEITIGDDQSESLF